MVGMRLDRLLSLFVFRPLRWMGFRNRGVRLPILMYHSIADDAQEEVEPYYRVATHPRRFAEQMQWLKDSGYAGVSLEEALTLLAEGKFDNQQPVAITFDDGFRDFHTAAWPVLQRHNFTATMYLATGFIAPERRSFRGKECLTWNEVRELHAQGIQFGSHTVNHPKLTELSWNEIENELALSKKSIEDELRTQVVSFAYPYAFPQENRRFTETFTQLLRRQGYRNCVTTVIGRARAGDDPFCLKRLPVNSDDDKALFAAKLDGDYDWLRCVQHAYRELSSRHSDDKRGDMSDGGTK